MTMLEGFPLALSLVLRVVPAVKFDDGNGRVTVRRAWFVLHREWVVPCQEFQHVTTRVFRL